MANQTLSVSGNYDSAGILGLVDGDTLTVDSLATLTIKTFTYSDGKLSAVSVS